MSALTTWANLIEHVQSLGFRAEQRTEPSPHFRQTVEQISPELPFLVPSVEEEEARLRTSYFDLLGMFVSEEGMLPVGIHLFCDRIIEESPNAGMSPPVLGLDVFWHETSHCHFYCSGSVEPTPSWLKPFDFEEAVCEALAYLAVKHGYYAPCGWRTLAIKDSWRLTAWRRRFPLFPYSWFPNLLGIADLVGFEALRDLVFVAGEAATAVDRISGGGARKVMNSSSDLLGDMIMLERGLLSIKQGALAVLRSRTRLKRRRPKRNMETDYPVIFWGIP